MEKLRDEHDDMVDLEVDMMVYGRLEAERKKQKRKEQVKAQLFLSNLFNPPKA